MFVLASVLFAVFVQTAYSRLQPEIATTAGISWTREPAVISYDRLPPDRACVVCVWRKLALRPKWGRPQGS